VKNSVSAVVSAAQEPFHMAGRDLIINYARPKVQNRPSADPCERLYFSGCHEGEVALREVLKNVEDGIVNIHFLRDGNTGETLPTGFVEFNTVEAATEAINLFDGTDMDSGIKLFFSYARPKKARREGTGSRYGDRRFQNRESYKTRSYRPHERDY
jgi:RNA recognition motif-containing protein